MDLTNCKSNQVHLQLHSHFTGSYNCAYDLAEIHEAFPVRKLHKLYVVHTLTLNDQPTYPTPGVLQGAAELPRRGGPHDMVGLGQAGTCVYAHKRWARHL